MAEGGIGVNDPRLAWSQSLNTEDSREDNRDWHCQAMSPHGVVLLSITLHLQPSALSWIDATGCERQVLRISNRADGQWSLGTNGPSFE